MRSFFVMRELWPWYIAIIGFVLLFSAYLILHAGKNPAASVVPIVSGCKKLGPGMRRIGEQYGVQFDVPVKDFIIHEGISDSPGGGHGFDLKPKNGSSPLVISWRSDDGQEGMRPPMDRTLTFSGPVENRRIFDDNGSPVGEDSWGYWEKGEFWRRVRLRGSVIARYGSINPGGVASDGSVQKKDAELFDHVINSVCILSGPSS
jgi:hypothetical protein